ncbi:carbohydrate ABC transporter substrate-binding protein (CUT1 family) [Motilibacter rhizosphaerae]|uniref:Carbohydrate ABC transporter substrate-binding protein (CUT1 family) n=1 Tax=Motilibacter rhizosphaerae TaxID=598652 RepID=A0A4Q7NSF4_9ACTN|nr:extracellular solute-binding protein [Motilibacter rhizosphaerae]RZS90027.1 carbohydrate ABC transporter substrate-binding protein (CUT1 family) [Motilibacter rhizosphaerae]
MKTSVVVKSSALVGVLALAAACGGSSGSSSSSAAASGAAGGSGGGSGKSVTLTFWHNSTTGAGKAFWDKTAADFTAAHPNVKIKVQAIQNEDLDGKLQTALNAGSGPDIFLQRGGGKMAAMAKAGQLMDITGVITDATKKVIPDAALAANSIDGKTYAMPVAVLPGGFWYSKDVFKKAGITTNPTTVAELQADVQKIKGAGTSAIALGAKDAWPAAHWYYFFALRECSPDTLSKAASSMTFDDPCWLKAGQDLQSFAATKPYNPGFLTTSAQQGAGSSAGLVANHKAAMELMGAWDPGVIGSLTPDKKPLADLDWFPFPEVSGGQGKPGSILGGIDGYSCSAKADKQACGDFMNYIATTPVQEGYYKAFAAPPVNTEAQAVVTEPYLKNVVKAYSSAPFVSEWLDTVYGQNVGNALNVAVVDLLAGKTDPAGVVKAVSAAAKKA